MGSEMQGSSERSSVCFHFSRVMSYVNLADPDMLKDLLEAAAAPVLSSDQRTHLQRALEAEAANTESSANARERRKLKRALERLQQTPEVQPHSKKPKTSPLAVAKHADGAHKEQALQDKKKHTPYVVFVGQLPFGCTSEELLTHFQKGGLQGEIRIRLLTSKNENKSKGTAFVEVDSAEQLHRCLALHKTSLRGRIINVEKSTGGKDRERRKSRIQDLKEQQEKKVSEKIEDIITRFENEGLIIRAALEDQIVRALHTMSPASVAACFRVYAQLSEERRKIPALRQIVFHKQYTGEDITPADVERNMKSKSKETNIQRGRGRGGIGRGERGRGGIGRGGRGRGGEGRGGRGESSSTRTSTYTALRNPPKTRSHNDGHTHTRTHADDIAGNHAALEDVFPSLRSRGGGLRTHRHTGS